MGKNLCIYRQVAIDALQKWNGLNEDEAIKTATSMSIEELENQIGAKKSIESGMNFLLNYLKKNLSNISVETLLNNHSLIEKGCYVGFDDETNKYYNVMGKEILRLCEEKGKSKESFVIDILSQIHDDWVRNNQGENTIEKKKSQNKEYQYLPLELIGWNEAKSDLLFIKPILGKLNIEVTEKSLREEYADRQWNYLKKHNVSDEEDLRREIAKGKELYPILEDEMIKTFQDEKVSKKVVSKVVIERLELLKEKIELERAIKPLEKIKHLINDDKFRVMENGVIAKHTGLINNTEKGEEEVIHYYDENMNPFYSNFTTKEEALKSVKKLSEKGIKAVIGKPVIFWPGSKECVGVYIVSNYKNQENANEINELGASSRGGR